MECAMPSPGPLKDMGGRRRSSDKGWVLGVVKHERPRSEQTRAQILGPLFPSSTTWPYYFISLSLGFIICEMGMVRFP